MKYLVGSVYPILLILIAVVLWHNDKIRETVKTNKKSILLFLLFNFGVNQLNLIR